MLSVADRKQIEPLSSYEILSVDEELSSKEEPKSILTGIDRISLALKKQELHRADKLLHDLSHPQAKLRKIAGTYISGLAACTNILSATAFKNKPFSRVLGDTSYRSFLVLNSALGALSGLKQNRALFALANIIDIPFAFLPRKFIYSGRRLYAGLAMLSNAVAKSTSSPLKPKGNKPYASLQDSLIVARETLQDFIVNTAKDSKNILSNPALDFKAKTQQLLKQCILNSERSSMGMIGGMASVLGASMHMLGLHSIGKFLGNVIGGAGLCINRVDPKNLEKGRLNYFLSGLAFAIGSFGDMISQPTISMISDPIAKIYTQEANRLNEVTRDDLSPVPNPLVKPLEFLRVVFRASE